MGWSFRKSKKLGPLRLNLSKAGVGWSVGNGLQRVTVRADGRVTKTTRIPGTGLSSQSTISGRKTQSKRGTRSSGPGCFTIGAILIGGVIAMRFLGKLAESLGGTGVITVLLLVGAIVVGIMMIRRADAKDREREAKKRQLEYLEGLLTRFGDEATDKILDGEPWEGATQPMIEEMLGAPADVSTKVLKSATKETWKFHLIAKNRYGLKVLFEDGVCVGWEKSSTDD